MLNLTKEQITKNELLKLLKKYSSKISVFDLMNLITASDNTFEWVSKKWTKLGNKMQVETFIFRMKALDTDFITYVGNHDNNDLKEYIFNLNETLDPHKSSAESYIIVFLSILYANYILEEPVHPKGTEFPGS